jgi:DNA (cytosine-5)-methyltransferase 1
MSIKYASVCSGVGGLGMGFDEPEFECVLQCEVDKIARSVLLRHYPTIPTIEDIHDVKLEQGSIDILMGGIPCQDYSVAGQRAGLAGDKGALWWEFHRIAREVKPELVIVENVPGLLSSNKGRDFRTIIESLVELGYRVCWRVLDARYFGVPQRRRRMFLVGSLGNGRAAEILFEPESVSRNTSKVRQKQQIIGTLAASGAGTSRPAGQGNELSFLVPIFAKTLLAKTFSSDPTRDTFILKLSGDKSEVEGGSKIDSFGV